MTITYQPKAILQDIDRCVRCRGCQVACERRSKMMPSNSTNFEDYDYGDAGDSPMTEENPYAGGATKISADDLVVVKSQRDVDMGPYVRYGCWHCLNPPCIAACPRGAIRQKDNTSKACGAITVDYGACRPDLCINTGGYTGYPCEGACRKGGYPKIGTSTSEYYQGVAKMYKCDMCWDRIEDDKLPMCVETCPAKAYTFGTMTEIIDKLNTPDPGTGKMFSYISGNDHFMWATRETAYSAPKSDPFVEDHISPMMDRLLSGPFSKAFLVPTAVVGGLYAIYRRRETIAEEQAVREGV